MGLFAFQSFNEGGFGVWQKSQSVHEMY